MVEHPLYDKYNMKVNNLKLFVFVCVPTRIALVVGAYYLEQPKSNVPLEPFIALAILLALGFFASDMNGKFFPDTKGAFGNLRYWDNLAHAGFISLFAALLYLDTGYAYTALIVDMTFGMTTVAEYYLIA
jgi:hypothetical protein